MDPFRAAIRSPKTRYKYEQDLAAFLAYAKTNAREFVRLAKADPKRAEGRILAHIGSMKEKGLKPGTIRTAISPVKLLLDMNDATGINWKKLRKTLPLPTKAEDRAPTVEEVRAVASDSDHRVKVAVLMMASGGLRIGGFDGLKVKHVEAVKKAGETVAARVKVYAGTRDEYSCFVSPEAWDALETYLSHRRTNGEKVTGESPLLRNRYKEGEAGKRAEPVGPAALSALINRRYRLLGIRPERKRRHEFAGAHGFRKFFKSRCEQVMKPLNVETLLGHETGLAGRYYRPREGEILEDYLKALPSLAVLTPQPSMVEAERVKSMEERLARLEAEKTAVEPAAAFGGNLGRALLELLDESPAFETALKAKLAQQKRNPATVSGRK